MAFALQRSVPMLHVFLSEHRDQIIERCEQYYRQRNPDWSREELLLTIPDFIDEIIKAERRVAGLPEDSKLPGDTDEARDHGAQRFRRGARIRDVAMDYGTISKVIGELAIEHGIELDARSYKLLNECIDTGIAMAIQTFLDLALRRGEAEHAEWLGYLAHELRNSLSSAVIAYSFIRGGHVGHDSKTARVLERSLNQLEALVSQTLVAVQLKSGVEPHRESIRVDELVEDVQAVALRVRDITLAAHVEPELTVVADPRLLSSAVTNLVQNALKFSRDGGRVEVRGRRDGARVVIEVQDECGGLSVASEQLFKPFVQVSQQRRSGVGLGLTITRNAIEVHGGTLTVENLPGHGCLFRISLPHT